MLNYILEFGVKIRPLDSQREGINNLQILNISSNSDFNLFWTAKILRTREIMTLFKLWILQFERSANSPISFYYQILKIASN